MGLSKRLRNTLLIGIGLVIVLGIVIVIWFPVELMSLLYSRPFYPTNTAVDLWNAPLALPDVITHVPVEYASGERFCIGVDTFRLWEPNSFDVYEAVSRSISLTIDNELVPRQDITVFQFTTLIGRFDEQGNLLGSHGGSIEICVAPVNLPVGLHVATASFTSNGGTSYAFQWAFRMTD